MKFTDSETNNFRVEVGPMSIEIYCSAFNAGRIYEKSEKPVALKYRGFASTSTDKEPYYYLVVNTDFEEYSYTRDHEVEHQKNRILSPKLYGTSEIGDRARNILNKGVLSFLRHQIGERVLKFGRDYESEIFEKYKSTKDPEKKAFLLTELMRIVREVALNIAKDEIIAMLKVDIPHIERFGYSRYTDGNYNIFTTQNGEAYDYMQTLREFGKKNNDTLWQKMAQKMLVDEYGKIIDNAIDAFHQLIGKEYSPQEVIAMLTDKRLAEWPKTVRRLVKQKEY